MKTIILTTAYFVHCYGVTFAVGRCIIESFDSKKIKLRHLWRNDFNSLIVAAFPHIVHIGHGVSICKEKIEHKSVHAVLEIFCCFSADLGSTHRGHCFKTVTWSSSFQILNVQRATCLLLSYYPCKASQKGDDHNCHHHDYNRKLKCSTKFMSSFKTFQCLKNSN